jgi:hypothetical protein
MHEVFFCQTATGPRFFKNGFPLLLALCFTQIGQIPTGTYNSPLSANPLLERVIYFSMDIPVGFLLDDINL